MSGALEALGGWSHAFLPVLVDAAGKGVVLLVLAGLVIQAMRRSSAAARQMVWVVALGAILAVPLVSAFLPAWRVLPGWARFAMPPAAPVTARPSPLPAPMGVAPPRTAKSPAADAPSPQPSPTGRGSKGEGVGVAQAAPAAPIPAPEAPKQRQAWWIGVVSWAPAIWSGGVLVCLAPLVLGRLSLWRLARRSPRVASGPLADLARQAAEAVGLKRRVVLLLSEAEPMPLVWGILRPRLLLPAEAETWPEDRLWVVLLHELGHARRRDCLAKLIAHVACAAHWFNPLAWLAFRWMQRDAEAACDDLVLASGHQPGDYATHLLEIASGLKSGMLAAYSSIAMARRSKLEGRLLAILDPRRSRRRLSLLLVLLAALIGTVILVPLSVLRARDTADPEFVSAKVVRWQLVGGRDKDDTIVVKEGEKIEQLASFFPGLGTGRPPLWPAGWDSRVIVTFERKDGTTLQVASDYDRWSTPGNGDWPVHGDLKTFVEMLFPTPATRPAGVEALFERLSGEDIEASLAAAKALGTIADAQVVERLGKIVADEAATYMHRSVAVLALGHVRGHTAQVMPILVEAAKTGGKDIKAVYEALSEQAIHDSAALPFVMEAVCRPGGMGTQWNCEHIDWAAVGPAAVPFLIEAISKPGCRDGITFALSELGAAAEPAIDELVVSLGASNPPYTRRTAARALEKIGPPAARATSALLPLLKDGAVSVPNAAAEALGAINPRSPQVIAALTAGLIHSDAEARWSAARALGQAGPAAVAALDPLTALFTDKSPYVRRFSAEAVGNMGPEARKAAGAVSALLTDQDVHVRRAAALATWRLTGDAGRAVEALTADLRSTDGWERQMAAEGLGEIGEPAAPAVPALIEVLSAIPSGFDHSLGQDREAAANALGRIGPAAKDALPALEKARSDPEDRVRQAAARAIAMIGSTSRPTRPLPPETAKWLTQKMGEAYQAAMDMAGNFDAARKKPTRVLTDDEIARLAEVRDAVEDLLLETPNAGAALLLADLDCKRALPVLRKHLLAERYFYGWDSHDTGDARYYLRDEQFPVHAGHIIAIERLSRKPLAEAVALTDAERGALEREAATAKVGGDTGPWVAKWLLAHLAGRPAPAGTTRPALNPRAIDRGHEGAAAEAVPGGTLRVEPGEVDHTLVWRWTFTPTAAGLKPFGGDDFPGASSGLELLASPDGKHLAVLSNCEGCWFLSVFDLGLILSKGEFKSRAEADAWPGSIAMVKWEGDALLIESEQLLTFERGEGEVPILFPEVQRFSVDPSTGQVRGVSDGATDPVGYFTRQLRTAKGGEKEEDLYYAAIALSQLKAVESLPALRAELAARRHAADREALQLAIQRLSAVRAAATRPGTAGRPGEPPGVVRAALAGGVVEVEPVFYGAPVPVTSRWTFRPAGSDKPRALGESLASRPEVTRLVPSPDEGYLAVVSVGAGRRVLEVIDWNALLQEEFLRRVATVDPYPGVVRVVRWEGEELVVASDMLLTHCGADGRVPENLSLKKVLEFRLNPRTGGIEAASPEGRDAAQLRLVLDADVTETEARALLAATPRPTPVPARPRLLPGSRLTDAEAAAADVREAVRCSALESPEPEEVQPGVFATVTRCRFVEAVTPGRRPPDEFYVVYTWESERERPMGRGEDVIWLLGIPPSGAVSNVQVYRGLKAYPVSAQSRAEVAAALAAAPKPGYGRWPDALPLLLPGGGLSISQAAGRLGGIEVAVLEALDDGSTASHEAGVWQVGQTCRVTAWLLGSPRTGELKLAYTRFGASDRPFRKGDSAIWVLQPPEDPSGRFWGVKALADTPANRETVVLAAGGNPFSEKDDVPWGAVSNGLRCRILPGRQDIALAAGQRLRDARAGLVLQVQNAGTKPVNFPPMNSPLGGACGGLSLVAPDGRTNGFPWHLPEGVPPQATDFITIGPGEVRARRVTIGWGLEFRNEGVHGVYFHVEAPRRPDIQDAWSGTLRSNEVKVNVIAAERPPRPAEPPRLAPAARPWANTDGPREAAVERAALILRAVAESQAEVLDRHTTQIDMISEGGHGIDGGGNITYVRCRQTFRVVEALHGTAETGLRTVEYRFRERSVGSFLPPEQAPVPVKASVILLSQADGEVIEMVPDTEVHRARVRDLVGRKSGATRLPTRPADAASDLDAFLTTHPKARRIEWQIDRAAYRVLYDADAPGTGAKGSRPGGAVAVFDQGGRKVYERTGRGGDESARQWLDAPVIVPTMPPVLAFLQRNSAPKMDWHDIILVGMKDGSAADIGLKYWWAGSYPNNYFYRTWLEDVDRDGKPEICRLGRHYYNNLPDNDLLRCLRWDAATGKWEWIEALAGRREMKDQPPVQWRVTSTYDEKTRAIDLQLEITSTADQPLVLSQPLPTLFTEGGGWRAEVQSEPGFASPVILKAGRAWGHTNWRVTPERDLSPELTIPPKGSAALRFKVDVPSDETPGKDFSLRLIGRAGWGRFEANYLNQQTPALRGPDVLTTRPDEPAWGEAVNGLRMRLVAETPRVTAGENIRLRLEIQNVRREPIEYVTPMFLPLIGQRADIDPLRKDNPYHAAITYERELREAARPPPKDLFGRDLKSLRARLDPGKVHAALVIAVVQETELPRTLKSLREGEVEEQHVRFPVSRLGGTYPLKATYRYPTSTDREAGVWQGVLETPVVVIEVAPPAPGARPTTAGAVPILFNETEEARVDYKALERADRQVTICGVLQNARRFEESPQEQWLLASLNDAPFRQYAFRLAKPVLDLPPCYPEFTDPPDMGLVGPYRATGRLGSGPTHLKEPDGSDTVPELTVIDARPEKIDTALRDLAAEAVRARWEDIGRLAAEAGFPSDRAGPPDKPLPLRDFVRAFEPRLFALSADGTQCLYFCAEGRKYLGWHGEAMGRVYCLVDADRKKALKIYVRTRTYGLE